ncbi:hypothetical protein CKA32_000994 [Geitlerinema sp. FC II]|nr:hypothetical protein CKA32_000994 [Geitlerinema sp. FC II]
MTRSLLQDDVTFLKYQNLLTFLSSILGVVNPIAQKTQYFQPRESVFST